MTPEVIAEYDMRIAACLKRVEVLGALPSDAKHQELLRGPGVHKPSPDRPPPEGPRGAARPMMCMWCSSRYVGPLFGPNVTCSDECHEKLVADLERQFGQYKKVVRNSTGEEFRVPVRDIVEVGVQERDLDHYPRWTDE